MPSDTKLRSITSIGPQALLDQITEATPTDIVAIWKSNGKWTRGRFTSEGITAAELNGELSCYMMQLYLDSEAPECDDSKK